MKRYLIILVATLTLSSCNDFLTEYSQNLTYVDSAERLNELLIGEAYMPTIGNTSSGFSFTDYVNAFFIPNVMDDDVEEAYYKEFGSTTTTYYAYKMEGFYKWQEYPYLSDAASTISTGGAGGDDLWQRYYTLILGCNVILEEIENYQDDDTYYNKVKGEALALRALWHFHLHNLWGAAYDVTSASTDLSVPIKISTEVNADGYERNTVAEVFEQITADLEQAIILLDGITQPTCQRINQTSARIFLSRLYLYMENWDKCIEHAKAAIDDPAGFSLADLNVNTNVSTGAAYTYSTYRTYSSNAYLYAFKFSENVFISGYTSSTYMQASSTQPVQLDVPQEVYNLYEDDDKRRSVYIYPASSGSYGRKATVVSNGFHATACGIYMPEAYMNYAEAAFLSGDRATAESMLAALRAKRYTTGTDYTAAITEASTDEDFMQFIRDERRRELLHRGHRWADLRRYAIHSKYPVKTTIKRYVNAWDSAAGASYQLGYYELGTYPEDGGWWLPFPYYAIRSNNGYLVDNERPERPLLQD